MPEYALAIVGVETCKATLASLLRRSLPGLRLNERRSARAAGLEEVEGVEEDMLARWLAPQLLEHCKPVLIAGDRLAVDQAGAATQLLPQPQLPFSRPLELPLKKALSCAQ